MRRIPKLTAVLAIVACIAAAQQRELKPGLNFFSKQQDIQLGREAARQVEKTAQIVGNKQLEDYIASLGHKLASQPQAGDYPYTFKVVNDRNINAFALPGGPTYVNTGLILAAENEAQLAGVLAHEISHVALRHGTNQVSKANLIQLPAMLASLALGNNSLLSQLGQIGVGLGANSLLLKFSRSAERDADLLGVRLMSEAGYNPIEMARFFEKLEAEGGARGPQFLSDHPNPGNRVKAVENEMRYLPQRRYGADTGRFARMKAIASSLPPPQKQPEQGSAAAPPIRPSDEFLEYRDKQFRLSYPGNWRTYGDKDASSVTIAPPEALRTLPSGATNVGYGIVVDFFYPERNNLLKATNELVDRLRSTNPTMRQIDAGQKTKVAGRKARVTTLYSDSQYSGQTEIDRLVTVKHPNGLFYIIFIAPKPQFASLQPVFDKMLASVRFTS